MEQQTFNPVKSSDVRYRKEKRFEIGDKVFLVGKKFVAERKEILYSENFERGKEINGKAEHISFNGMFILRNKLLTVDFSYYLSYGPLGDRINFDVFYDNQQISKYRFLHSYMGGGANGEWPTIKNEKWNLLFVLKNYSDESGPRNFSIEYYENIVPDIHSTFDNDSSNKSHLKSNNVPDKVLTNKFELEALKKKRKKCWETIVPSINNKKNGKLICYSYQGFQKYSVTAPEGWFCKKIDEFVGYSINSTDELFVIEYRCNGQSQLIFPWNEVEINVADSDKRFSTNSDLAKNQEEQTNQSKKQQSKAAATIEYFLKRGATLGTKTGGILMPTSKAPNKPPKNNE